MKKTQLTEKDYLEFFKTYLFRDTFDPIFASLEFAYRNVCRTIHGLSEEKYKNEMINGCKRMIYKNVTNLLKADRNNINQEEYDKFIYYALKDITGIPYFYNSKLTIGQAQKWFNMTIKYLSIIEPEMVENFYEYCHIPIDNYILKETNYKGFKTTWIRIDNYDDYLEFQKWFRNKYDEIPLDVEFKLWINRCKIERNANKRKLGIVS